jgi:hypothetical protein
VEASRFFQSDFSQFIPASVPPIVARIWQAADVYYADPRRFFEPPTYAQLSKVLYDLYPDKAGSTATIFRAHSKFPTLLPWPIRRGMRPPWEQSVVLEVIDNVMDLDPGWVHVGWSCDDLGAILCCTDSLPAVLGYTRDEVVGHPGTRILAPSARSGDPRILAIVEAMQRLRRGETTEEPISEYLEHRDGSHLECRAVMMFRVVQPADHPIWDVVAEVRPSSKMK